MTLQKASKRRRKRRKKTPKWLSQYLKMYSHARVLLPENVKHPSRLILSEVARLGGNTLIAFGESNHHGTGALKYEARLVSALHRSGYRIRKVFLEEDEQMSRLLARYCKTGIMPKFLKDYLQYLFVREDDCGHGYKLGLVRLCRRLRIPIRFIDSSKVVDRDVDWAQKIIKEIGEEMDGLYLLVAGRSHVSHSDKVYCPIDAAPVVAFLDKKYSGRVISINCQTNRLASVEGDKCLEKKFLQDLTKLNRKNTSSAIKVAKSPYRALLLYPHPFLSVPTIAEAFDILVSIPGKVLVPRRHKQYRKYRCPMCSFQA